VTHKELLKLLDDEDIPFVLVGGTAMRLYNSPRVTHDIDISIRVLDIDRVVELMYTHGYYLVYRVDESFCWIALGTKEALDRLEQEKAGSASFVRTAHSPENPRIAHGDIDIETQVDYLFELSIPFPKLKQRARTVELDDFSFLIAAPEDLLDLKRARPDKDEADKDDIRFLEKLIQNSSL